MPDKRDVVTGRYVPQKDENGEQIVHPEKGRKWQLIADYPHDFKRKRKYRIVYGSERHVNSELQKFLSALNEDLGKRRVGSISKDELTKMTLSEWVEEWLDSPQSIKQRTKDTYRGFAKHIVRLMGHIPLYEIEPYHIAKYRDMMLHAGFSPSTINKHLSLLSAMLEDAASPEKQLLDRNPALSVKRLRKGKNQNRKIENCLNPDKLNDLLDKLGTLYSMRGLSTKQLTEEDLAILRRIGYTEEELKSPKALHKFRATGLYPIVRLVSVTGLRLSEALALKWQHVDWDEGVIKVYESSHYGRGAEHHINSTKEGKPKSYMDLDPEDMEFLRQHKRNQARQKLISSNWQDNDLVFPASDGSYLRNEHVTREFTLFLRGIGYEGFTFHGLRHTHCTLLLRDGADLWYVMQRLGHSNLGTTNEYAHVLQAKKAGLGTMFRNILNSSL